MFDPDNVAGWQLSCRRAWWIPSGWSRQESRGRPLDEFQPTSIVFKGGRSGHPGREAVVKSSVANATSKYVLGFFW